MNHETRVQVFKPGRGAIEPIRGGESLASPDRPPLQKGMNLPACWLMLRKHRQALLVIFFATVVPVALWTFTQTPIYRSRALVEIETEGPNVVTAQDLFTLNSVTDVYLETQYKVLESDTLAERVIDELNLHEMPEFNPPKRHWLGSSTLAGSSMRLPAIPNATGSEDADAFGRTLTNFRARLGITPLRRSRLVEITFESQDPQLAARVVNTLAADYSQQNAQARRDESKQASQWLSEQLTDTMSNLQQSEAKLQNYARGNGLLYLETTTGENETLASQRLQRFQEELTVAQAARNEKESLYRLLRNGEYASVPGVFDSKLIQDLSVQLAELQKQYAQLTATFSSGYFRVKEVENQIREIEGALTRERNRAGDRITNDYIAAVNREKLARQNFEDERKAANQVAERLTEFSALRGDVEANKKLYTDLTQRVKEAGFSTELSASKVRIVDPGNVPPVPVRPMVALNLGLGTMLGLVLAVGFVFLRESMDETLKSPEQVEQFLNLPTLAYVPTIKTLKPGTYSYPATGLLGPGQSPGRQRFISLFPLSSSTADSEASAMASLSEAFRSLCTSMLFSIDGRGPTSVLIASTQAGEGKTMVATNLAITLGELGHRVLLIDADMRRPRIQDAFAIKSQRGLSSYLEGKLYWRETVCQTGRDGVDVLLSGPPHPNPVQLLSSRLLRKLLDQAGVEYQYVILDSPPLLNVADARILAGLVEGVILVVKSGATPRILLRRAESFVRGTGASLLGVVLNNFAFSDDSYYGLSNSAYYGPKI